MTGEPNGTLFDWRDIATSYKWDTLLLGNGMSINIWEPFGYRKLYDRAKFGDLSAQDRKLFSSTPNFERVLADLLTAIRVNNAVGLDTEPLLSDTATSNWHSSMPCERFTSSSIAFP